MSNSRVARRYAKALFELASEKKQLEKVAADFHRLAVDCREVESLRNLLASPVVQRDVKLALLEKIYKSSLQPLSFGFIELLMQKGRESSLAAVAEEFQRKVDDFNGVVRGDVQTVLPMSNAQRETLLGTMGKLTGKQVLLSEQVDEALLGGVMVRIGDMVYDASVRHQLVKLRENLAQS